MPGRRLSGAQARRVALAAQGFGRPRPATVTMRHVQTVIDRVAQFQIDSVNVVTRAHFVPLFARLGPYDVGLLERAASRAPRRLVEYWGHAACLLDVTLWPALAVRRRRYTEPEGRTRRILAHQPDLLPRILGDVAASGPVTPRDIDHTGERARDHWGWNWSEAKHVLEHLYDSGRVAVAGRAPTFERRYDLPERVLPAHVNHDLSDDEAIDTLVRRAARALGIADLASLATYFYLGRAVTARAVARLAASGELERVTVAGRDRPYWLAAEARLPRWVRGQALVSPFDTLVFDRERLADLFGVHYRIEIYTPAAQRRYGYYVYLFVCDEQIAARVDLKAERARGVLRVQSAWLEPDAEARETAARLAAELGVMASWLGLTDVAVEPRGDLAAALAAALG